MQGSHEDIWNATETTLGHAKIIEQDLEEAEVLQSGSTTRDGIVEQYWEKS